VQAGVACNARQAYQFKNIGKLVKHRMALEEALYSNACAQLGETGSYTVGEVGVMRV
jgi:hypothetical protein